MSNLEIRGKTLSPGEVWDYPTDVSGLVTTIGIDVLAGRALVVATGGDFTIPAGVSKTWETDPSGGVILGITSVTADAESVVFVSWTEK